MSLHVSHAGAGLYSQAGTMVAVTYVRSLEIVHERV